MSDLTPVHRQRAKPVNSNIDVAKPQAPLKEQNARAMTPCKAKPIKDAPKAQATFKVEAAPVAKQAKPKFEAALVVKQATPAKQEKPKFGSTLAFAPPVAMKVDKANKVKSKPAALSMAPDHRTRTSECSNKNVPPPRLVFQSAILIIAFLPIHFGTAFGNVIYLQAYGSFSEIFGKIAMDEGPSLFSMLMRLEIHKENTIYTKRCHDNAAIIVNDENDKQTIRLWIYRYFYHSYQHRK